MASTNFIDGLTNVGETETLGTFVGPDPSKAHVWFDDFDSFVAGNWTVTETQAGATQAITAGDGGLLALVNSAADDDLNAIQLSQETWRWAANKDMWMKARFKVSDATQSDLVIGLQITDTTPLDVTDGMFFIKADASTSLTFRAEKNNTASTVTVGTLADDTFVIVGFHWSAEDSKLDVFLNNTRVGSLTTTTNFPDDEDLTVSIAVQNGEAAAKTLTVDYMFIAKER